MEMTRWKKSQNNAGSVFANQGWTLHLLGRAGEGPDTTFIRKELSVLIAPDTTFIRKGSVFSNRAGH